MGPLLYLKLNKIKGPKMHSLFTFHFHNKTSAGVEFYKRNPFNFFLKSQSIFKRNPIEKIRIQFYMEIPLLFSKNHKLETIFEKSHRSSVILKIVGATPQLVQNLTPIRNLLCTFFYLCCCYP